MHVLHGETAVFAFDDGAGELTVRLRFQDKRNAETTVEYEELDEQDVRLTFLNFDDPNGQGNKKRLLEVGEYRGRDLYLRYFVVGSRDSEHMFLHYTWFLSESSS